MKAWTKESAASDVSDWCNVPFDTLYRSFWGRFYRSHAWPNQQRHSTEGQWSVNQVKGQSHQAQLTKRQRKGCNQKLQRHENQRYRGARKLESQSKQDHSPNWSLASTLTKTKKLEQHIEDVSETYWGISRKYEVATETATTTSGLLKLEDVVRNRRLRRLVQWDTMTVAARRT